jgi:hypothetical protein
MTQQARAVVSREYGKPVVVAGPKDTTTIRTSSLTFEEAPQAFADLPEGRNARGVILFESKP